ncbi:MAG: MATE family efflux transporter [bacterium]|nr:MATE family efflux transporter [bacterium]
MIKLNADLLKGKILQSLLIFAFPIFISNVFQQLYNTVDTMIVGNFLGDESLAAIGACSAIFELLVGFAIGISSGLGIVTARSYGSGDKELLKRSVAGSIIIGVIVTTVIMILSTMFLSPLLRLLNTPEDIMEEAYSYISVVTLLVGVMFAYNLCAGLLRAIGNSIMPLVFLIISSVLNIVLDLAFITQFHMGIRGAAVATVISQCVSAIFCIFYIIKKCPMLLPQRRHFHVEKELYIELIGQGLSSGFMVSIVSMGTVILQTAINGLGYLVIAGHVSARKLNSFCIMPLTTMALAISTFVSQNKGANQGERIRKAVKYATIFSICWGALISLILLFAAPILVKVLSGSSESVVINNGSAYLRINSPFYMILGMLFTFRYSLQGIGKKFVPLISSIIELGGKIIFVAIFIPILNYMGVILCEPIIWCFMCAQLAYSFYHNDYIRSFKAKNNTSLKQRDLQI